VANVTCCICGVLWNPADRGVSYRSIDHKWWCTSYTACQARVEHARRTDVARMFAALDQVWDQLEKDGWKI